MPVITVVFPLNLDRKRYYDTYQQQLMCKDGKIYQTSVYGLETFCSVNK
jgi:hypothetical protein